MKGGRGCASCILPVVCTENIFSMNICKANTSKNVSSFYLTVCQSVHVCTPLLTPQLRMKTKRSCILNQSRFRSIFFTLLWNTLGFFARKSAKHADNIKTLQTRKSITKSPTLAKASVLVSLDFTISYQRAIISMFQTASLERRANCGDGVCV